MPSWSPAGAISLRRRVAQRDQRRRRRSRLRGGRVPGARFGPVIAAMGSHAEAPSAGTIPDARQTVAKVVLILAIGLFWGGNWPAVKTVLFELPPITLRAIGFSTGALALLAWARARDSAEGACCGNAVAGGDGSAQHPRLQSLHGLRAADDADLARRHHRLHHAGLGRPAGDPLPGRAAGRAAGRRPDARAGRAAGLARSEALRVEPGTLRDRSWSSLRPCPGPWGPC